MRWLSQTILALAGAFLFFQVAARLLKRFSPRPCPSEISWILENPLRERLLSASKTLKRVGVGAGTKVLELGPGPGFLSIEASRIIGESGRLCCLDIQPKMLAKLKRKVGRNAARNVDLVVGDANSLPFADNSFHLAFLVCVLGEIPRNEVALSELHRVLRPGGVLSITEWFGDPDYSTRSAVSALGERAGFKPVETIGHFLYYTINFGKAQKTSRKPLRRGKAVKEC